jgi:hypothetical protein
MKRKLQKAITFLVCRQLGKRKETHLPLSFLRIRYLLFLADWEFYRQRGKTYLGYEWSYASQGPWFRELTTTVNEMDGLEIVDREAHFYPGRFDRFKDDELNIDEKQFEQILSEMKRQYYFLPDKSIGNLIYATKPMQNKTLGDSLF